MRINRLRKNSGISSSRGAGLARELGIHEHGIAKSMARPVFLDSGPGPEGPSRNDSRVFPHPAHMAVGGGRQKMRASGRIPAHRFALRDGAGADCTLWKMAAAARRKWVGSWITRLSFGRALV